MILCADFGGTTIKIGLVHEGCVLARTSLEALANRPMPERLEAVAGSWENLLTEAGKDLSDVAGVALSLPFFASPCGTRVLGEFGKFPGATTIDFRAWSSERLGLPLVLENDLRVALLGEQTAVLPAERTMS